MRHPTDKSILVVGGSPDLLAVIGEAARRAFPNGTPAVVIGESASWKTLVTPSLLLLVLVLVLDDDAEGNHFLTTTGCGADPCPVVRLGVSDRPDGTDVVPPDEWNAPLLARVFRSAVREHSLRCQNARARGDLLTVGRRISHDLRTPLGGIVASADLLQDVLAGQQSPHLPLVRPLYDSLHDLEKLIERASFLATASATPVAKGPVPMGECVLVALGRFERRILAAHASVSQPSDWPVVQGVATWLRVVWWNLIANAVQHGGNAPQIDLGWSQSGNGHSFWVRDNGEGVAPGRRGRLFMPFDRLHEPGSARGLGLSIVQRLVELQGGQCRYDPIPAGGACFTFTLPNS